MQNRTHQPAKKPAMVARKSRGENVGITIAVIVMGAIVTVREQCD
tara:strand:+ start:222 stop:356 length:135 start_codon:yes stop_codon:yes gene_type:complete